MGQVYCWSLVGSVKELLGSLREYRREMGLYQVDMQTANQIIFDCFIILRLQIVVQNFLLIKTWTQINTWTWNPKGFLTRNIHVWCKRLISSWAEDMFGHAPILSHFARIQAGPEPSIRDNTGRARVKFADNLKCTGKKVGEGHQRATAPRRRQPSIAPESRPFALTLFSDFLFPVSRAYDWLILTS